MRKVTVLVFLLIPLFIFSQVNLKKISKESHNVFAFKITASLAEKFIRKDSINIDAFLSETPAAVFPKDSVDLKNLPIGHYVLIRVQDNRVVAKLTSVSNLSVYPVNNQHHVQLLLISNKGEFINDAKVWVNGKDAPYRRDAQSYWVSQKNPDTALIKVYTKNDTLFSSLWILDELETTIRKQRLENFKNTRFVRTITWLPEKISTLFKKKFHYKSPNAGTAGIMVFNQPKYKQTDTVKLKAYVFSKKRKTYKKPVNVFLEYQSVRKNNKIFLKYLEPSNPGSYVFQFPLSDSLQTDISYSVVFRTNDNKRILSKTFRIEDYLLDEISSYNIRSTKEIYYASDTFHVYTSALDANGLSLLDCNTKLALTTENIVKFYPDSVYIADTLYTDEKPLSTNGETKFEFTSGKFPDADLSLKANIVFKNGNNEFQEKSIELSYRPAHKEFKAYVEGDSVIAIFRENGRIVAADGVIHIHNDREETRQARYPFKIKIDPFADSYTFHLLNSGKKVDSAHVEITEKYEPQLTQVSHGDTLGFVLDNPFDIPVSFTVFDGSKIIGAGKSSGDQIRWTIKVPNKNRAYRVSWQYYWKGEEQIREKLIALLHKLLNIEVRSNSTVFPGQKDTIAVHVRDYKDNPVPGVNLTALSYNNQFSKDIYVPDPPYLVKYIARPRIKRNKYEQLDGYITKYYPLGQHIHWIKRFGLDSMPYYNMLFPKHGMLDAVTPISDFLPQLSVHLAKKGERQEIYLLYLNRNLVYYNGVTEKIKDAYQDYIGYTQIGIRLFDQFIEIDSIYMQPFYKHDLFFDIDNLPAHTKISKLTPAIMEKEKSLLQKSLWNLDNNFKTNDGYVWQGERLVPLSGNRTHLVGPFREKDSLHFFAPGNFDIHFVFEPGYQYNLSKQVLRLEKRKIFPNDKQKYELPRVISPEWILGDTIPVVPEISYSTSVLNKEPYLKLSKYPEFGIAREGDGKLYFTIARDTVLKYVILFPSGQPEAKLVFPGDLRMINNLKQGEYTLLLVNKAGNAAEKAHLIIQPNQTLCIHTEHAVYNDQNPLIVEWTNQTLLAVLSQSQQDTSVQKGKIENMPAYQKGNASITGKVTDKNGGHGIPGAIILINGSGTGVSTKSDGSFTIDNIKSGKCTLSIASVGYVKNQIPVDVPENGYIDINISLAISSQNLQDVVVSGYGATRRRNLTSGFLISGDYMLQGKAAGISIIPDDQPGPNFNFIIRGLSSTSANQRPLFIIDGILYDAMPANVSPDIIASIEVLKNNEATAIYGSRAANGAILISTKTKNLRTQFRDYAFWQPELFTDENGQVKFTVEYPDNITGWQTYILAMDKRRRMGKSYSFIKSFKPLLAQIALPQFLIAGDTVEIKGKSLNYTNDPYFLQTSFSIDGKPAREQDVSLKAKESFVQNQTILAPSCDSLQASFNIKTTTGFKDGEERKIPILKKGANEVNGQFWVLDRDTILNFRPSANSESIECFAQNNTLDILLSEIDNLKKYPYYCLEQTASKLRGLLMEKEIKEKTHKPFNEDKTINLLLGKLQKSQLYDGGWSWWENGKANLYITNYVIQALLPLRSNPMVEKNIRNGLLFLQNQMHSLGKDELLSTLLTMSEANHLIDYQTWLHKIDFDSLNIHQQWQIVKIKQLLNLEHSSELSKITPKGKYSMLGGLHWGEESYRWYNDQDATTVLGFEVLQKEKNREKELNSITQYFLEQRAPGFWGNTVASASIVSALLPYVLSNYKNFSQPAVLAISGDTSFSIRQYPFKLSINNKNVHQLSVNKTGGGITYLTFYQHFWDAKAEPVNNYFTIDSYFEKNSQKISYLNSGEKTKMIVEVKALKDADYVMIEIPIPGGCVYGSKVQDDWNTHKEFLKDKVVIFSEKLAKGVHRIELDLESRYNGRFTINPANASLMYFPSFYGRNEMKQIAISQK